MANVDDKGVVMTCRACGKSNRIPFARIGQTAGCGECKAALPPPAVPVPFDTAAQVRALIDACPLPVLVDFWASWCGPCQTLAPELKKAAASAVGRLLVVKVDTDDLADLARRHRIQSVPTLVLFFHGREVKRSTGVMPANAILDFALRNTFET